MKNETAVLGGGCFWCIEAIYTRIAGVTKVQSGYAGGRTQNPTYQSVCNGNTGHAEVVRIEFDPNVISYEGMIEIFWHAHDPTTRNKQGFDIGSQYRSIILYLNETQKNTAERSRNEADSSGNFRNPIVTEIVPLDVFYPAKDYHQDFFARNPHQPYCRVIISPKVRSFIKKYPDMLKKTD